MDAQPKETLARGLFGEGWGLMTHLEKSRGNSTGLAVFASSDAYPAPSFWRRPWVEVPEGKGSLRPCSAGAVDGRGT